MSDKEKAVQVSVTLPKGLLEDIEKVNIGESRAKVIRDLLEKSIKESNKKKKNGVVYTPQYFAEYLSVKMLSYVDNITENVSNKPTILDPACGEGVLLKEFYIKYKKHTGNEINIVGVDLDSKSIKLTSNNLGENFIGFNENALCPYNKNRNKGWEKIKSILDKNDGFDYIIANPPWGADFSYYNNLLKEGSFKLLKGQVDTSDLFLELSIDLLKLNGIVGFIIPDSIFSSDRSILRKFLLDNTQILYIGRFGEKIFKDINRACAIIILKKVDNPAPNYDIDCFRLPLDEKDKILKGVEVLSNIEGKYLHKVNVSRFLSTREFLFNLDVDSTFEKTYKKISIQSKKFHDYLINYRGIELSKKGKIIKCVNCGCWNPFPRKEIYTCHKCSLEQPSNGEVKVIIHKYELKNSFPLIVGENINRYKINYDLWIDTSNKGINYKSLSIYQGDKIVVRKTGIGVSASIDYTSSYTNQVVYIFKMRENSILGYPLEFFMAILNSRVMFFFLSMSSGNIEWKSHPYLTQKQILEIPIPDFHTLSGDIVKDIKKYSNELKNSLKKNLGITKELDINLEKIVARIYKLDVNDYTSIFRSIEKSQELLSVKALKNISLTEIFKI
ncbi:TPA: N-6 DNA methylase [Proteus mirabilis]|nr:N-6 DNA methylase [Proteus mirabilis]